MEEKKYRLVIDGNAFYELDLECQKKKEQMKKNREISDIKKKHMKRQRD